MDKDKPSAIAPLCVLAHSLAGIGHGASGLFEGLLQVLLENGLWVVGGCYLHHLS